MASDARPNILLIMTDQQRGDALSCARHPVLLTPNMDTIAEAGVRFSHCYSTCPTCIAARRSLLSGQYPRTHGMVGYRDGVPWQVPPTLPDVLREHGYQTRLVGRNMHQHPPRRRLGYDEMTLYPQDYGRWLAERAPEAGGVFGGGVMHNDWTARPWHLDEHLHPTNWTVEQALDFLRRRDPSCPFFLTVSFIAPHPPLSPPAFYMERYLRQELPPRVLGDWASPDGYDLGGNDKVAPSRISLEGEALRSARAAYYGLINHIDDQLRRLLNPINGVDVQTGRNTVVLFCADHGEMLGDHYLWRKSVPYEPSARVPLLIRAPDRYGLQHSAVIDAPVSLEDVMPTLLELADVPIPPTVEGRSLIPLLRGESVDWRPYLHIEHAPLHHSLTDAKTKYIWWVRDGREQLFDLTSDPLERHDLASDTRQRDRLVQWRERLVSALADRPEGFVKKGELTPGVAYVPVLPHAPAEGDRPAYGASHPSTQERTV